MLEIFLLIDRDVADQLKKSEDRNLYIRGMIFSYGYSRIGIPYRRNSRTAGKSKFPFRKMFSFAIDGIISQSIVPLRLASYVALFVTITTFFLGVFYLFLKFSTNIEIQTGFTTTVLLILSSISLNAFFLGIIGEYLARIYQQVKKEPITIIAKEIDIFKKKT